MAGQRVGRQLRVAADRVAQVRDVQHVVLTAGLNGDVLPAIGLATRGTAHG